ncbi:trfA family protein [Janthinobacterium agaricidamnosum NBRC 102515 = DSM 9628]|uniref:TrfA family protein n=1 Tax=Janthinobacterium agaricidamnosum NBRC 102515 = DSM 9628 TaxID=1349767 RepID=W0VFJ2_9BURK|nr:trfA family protein [Janthinobacterium agaricidamnosum NBRC 102515 = DSM 9628]
MHALEKLETSRRKAPKKPAPQMSLDLWPDAVRGVPNAVLRGALFSISKRREFVKNELIASVEGHQIRFTGQRFNQTDLDTFEMLVHLARLQPLGNRVDFTAHSLLKTMGRGTGKSQHQQLHDEIIRLRSGNVEITWEALDKVYGEGLVKKYYMDRTIGRYVVELSPEMLTLYETGYSQVDWGQRQALTNNLSKWLHGFYASHAKPYPYKVSTIKDLCGSTSKDLRDFRRMLKTALADLVTVGMLVDWTIDEKDLVTVQKVPTFSQRQYLERAAKKQRGR